jgi:hypothetical protein
VGNNEAPTALVWSSDVGGSKNEGTGSIAESLEICSDVMEPPIAPVIDVLDNNPSGSHLADNAGVLIPEPRAGPLESVATTCDTEILAREAAADEIDGSKVACVRFADIGDLS